MARITAPLDPIPGFNFQGLDLPVPVDLPEGGFLQVVVGDNPLGQAIPSVQIPKGCMLAIVPPGAAAQIRPALEAALAKLNDPATRFGIGANGDRRILP